MRVYVRERERLHACLPRKKRTNDFFRHVTKGFVYKICLIKRLFLGSKPIGQRFNMDEVVFHLNATTAQATGHSFSTF